MRLKMENPILKHGRPRGSQRWNDRELVGSSESSRILQTIFWYWPFFLRKSPLMDFSYFYRQVILQTSLPFSVSNMRPPDRCKPDISDDLTVKRSVRILRMRFHGVPCGNGRNGRNLLLTENQYMNSESEAIQIRGFRFNIPVPVLSLATASCCPSALHGRWAHRCC